MARPYSKDLRERAVAAMRADGLTCRRAATQFRVAPSTASNWLNLARRSGSVEPGNVGGHRPRTIYGEHDTRRMKV
jgi:transposase